MSDPKTTPPPTFTLLIGDDTIGREASREKLRRTVRERFSNVGEEVFDASRESLGEFLQRFLTPSLFDDARVFHVRHAQQLDENIKEISAVLNNPAPDVFLLIEAEEGGEGKRARAAATAFKNWTKGFARRAKKDPRTYQLRKFPKPRDYEMPAWLAGNVPQILGRRISRDNAEYLIDLIGTDPANLRSELSKADLNLPEGKPITAEAIDAYVASGRPPAPRELAQALGRRDAARVLELIDALCSSASYLPACIPAIFRHFWALFRIRHFARSSPEQMKGFLEAVKRRDREGQGRLGLEIGIAAGIMQPGQGNRVYPMLIKPGLIDQARDFTNEDLAYVFRLLCRYDVGAKTGQVHVSRESLQFLCFKILRAGRLDRTG